ncbi:mechanosensitive ion channel family protein [Pontibacter sp. BT310]|uniref:Mechanosensitive ion channel family protein n=1 Tax=Pontibacter populi TaxID=890055 RepID=A0ABS6X8R0_9BACT|nr:MULTISPECIES: mechanosensitive ion channel family protein [Pontibacter]MBJ6117526.1 mechanosensitive ion channel family protein [Pontibacter sp. BT310]MBR0569951.1 mechanosensitive ion channel family protein [Microvirga sp. STS03]MBW3364379.1 mechanosensitive ion channel family protein [Pontibacter populi]
MDLTSWREILNYEFLGNTVSNYLWFVGILLFGFIFKTMLSKLVSTVLYKLVKRFWHEDNLPAFRRLLIQPLEVVLFLVFLYFAFQVLDYPMDPSEIRKGDPFLKTFFFRTYQVFVIVALTWVVLRLVDFTGLIFQHRTARTASKMDDQLVPFFKDFSKVMVVIFSIMVMLGAVFGVNVAGLVAGLGVGGLAIAFAAKESLENLLASFTIFLDHPFVVGDLVEVGGITGTIEKIGFRSTRIRTLEKSFVTVPNKSMIDKPLNNLTLRTFRRVQFEIPLTFDTTAAQIRAIVTELQQYINNHPQASQDGIVRFQTIGPASKNIMVLYFVESMDWTEYVDIKEEMIYKVTEVVERHGAQYAPTQSVFMQATGQLGNPTGKAAVVRNGTTDFE